MKTLDKNLFNFYNKYKNDLDLELIDYTNKINNSNKRIIIVATNISHLKMVKELLAYNKDFNFIIRYIPYMNKNILHSSVVKELVKEIEYKVITFKDVLNSDLIIFYNDWNPIQKFFILFAFLLRKKTVVIQESVIDFYKQNKMQYADYAIIQGIDSYKFLKHRKNVFLNGNIRYKYNFVKKRNKVIMINYNMFFSELKNKNLEWLDKVINVCKKLKIDFFISVHPTATLPERYYKNYTVIDSKDISIEDQLKQASIVISRFSSVIHEAIFFGCDVIYADFYNEKNLIGYDYNEDFDNVFNRVYSEKELQNLLDGYIYKSNYKKRIEYLTFQTGVYSNKNVVMSMLNTLEYILKDNNNICLRDKKIIDLLINLLFLPIRILKYEFKKFF